MRFEPYVICVICYMRYVPYAFLNLYVSHEWIRI